MYVINISIFLRAVLVQTVPVACPESQALRYHIPTHTSTHMFCLEQIFGDILYGLVTSCALSLQGDRGFDGLPGLPGEKGHRVSTAWWMSVRSVCRKPASKKYIVCDFTSNSMVLHCCSWIWTLVLRVGRSYIWKESLQTTDFYFAWETTPPLLYVFKLLSKLLLVLVTSHRTGFQTKSLSYWGFTFLDYCLDLPKSWMSFKKQ